MEEQREEQEKLQQRWKWAAETLQAVRSQEREAVTRKVSGVLLSTLLTLLFVVGISVWLAQRIMAQ